MSAIAAWYAKPERMCTTVHIQNTVLLSKLTPFGVAPVSVRQHAWAAPMVSATLCSQCRPRQRFLTCSSLYRRFQLRHGVLQCRKILQNPTDLQKIGVDCCSVQHQSRASPDSRKTLSSPHSGGTAEQETAQAGWCDLRKVIGNPTCGNNSGAWQTACSVQISAAELFGYIAAKLVETRTYRRRRLHLRQVHCVFYEPAFVAMLLAQDQMGIMKRAETN